MNTAENDRPSDAGVPPLPEVARVQREILASMRAGLYLSNAHKEGGTTISRESDRFVIADYGDSNNRQEFADDDAFLRALWKRFDWTAPPRGGSQRLSELEGWKFILRQLRHKAPAPAATTTTSSWLFSLRRVRLIAAAVVLVVAAIAFGAMKLLTVRTIGMPFGQSVRAGDAIATFIRTQEPYVPSLHRNPDRDRFRLELRLTPLARDARPRMINLGRDLDRSAFQTATRILGTEGPLLWVLAPELHAVDLRRDRLITGPALRKANPGMDAFLETARPHFAGRLFLLSPDRQSAFTIDPETLRVRREDTIPRIDWQNPTPSVEAQLCLGGTIAPAEWIGLLAPAERQASFQPGQLLGRDHPAERSREPRSLHRVVLEPMGLRFRITSIDTLAEQSFVDGALIRSAPGEGPQRLADPDGFLLTHRIGTLLAPTVGLARVDTSGRVVWSIDTGLRALDQILPHPQTPVLVGTLPAQEGKVPEPVLVIIDAATGSAANRSLRL